MKRIKQTLVIVSLSLFVVACGDDAPKQENPFSVATPADKGGKIFQSKCAVCHSMKADLTGPALNGVIERWDNDTVNLKAFIQNSGRLIAAGEPHAVRIFEKYKTTMPAFPSFTDEELSQLIAFLKN